MVDSGVIVFLIILLILIFGGGITALVVAIIVSVSNKKYTNYVLEKSEMIKDLKLINKDYSFFDYQDLIKPYQRYANKNSWRRADPEDYLISMIKKDYYQWAYLKEKIDRNRELYKEYKNKIINLKTFFIEESCNADGFKYDKCVKFEKKIFASNVLHPKTDITITVRLRYVSPKGQVDESKIQTYHFNEFVRILNYATPAKYAKYVSSAAPKATPKEISPNRNSSTKNPYINENLRYEVMKRDGFRCTKCGLTRSDGVMLHVDYINQGGEATLSNLCTLCDRCEVWN